MFSGIIEEAAPVVAVVKDQDNLHITMSCTFTNELKIDQSVAHNGVCLTVVSKTEDTYTVTAISLSKAYSKVKYQLPLASVTSLHTAV
jgi:riboflavin synthase